MSEILMNICDTIRQSNEPQGERKSCSNPQGRDVALLRVLSAATAAAHVELVDFLWSDPFGVIC